MGSVSTLWPYAERIEGGLNLVYRFHQRMEQGKALFKLGVVRLVQLLHFFIIEITVSFYGISMILDAIGNALVRGIKNSQCFIAIKSTGCHYTGDMVGFYP